MVLDSGEVFMDQVEGKSVGSSREPGNRVPKTTATNPRPPARRSNVAKKEKEKEKVSHNGLPAQTNSSGQLVERRSSSLKGGATPRPPLRRPLSLEMTPQRLRGSQEQMADRRIVQPPWRSGSAAPSPPARSLTSPSLGAGGWMRRSESTCSVNYSLGLRAGRGQMRPATSLPHIAKGTGSTTMPGSARPCLLVALRPLNLEQEKQAFFQSDYKYEPQFEYAQPEPRSVLEKYREGSGLFLEQAVGIMECVLKKFASYENFEDVTGGNVLPKSQVWAAVRKYLQKEGCVGEVVVRLSDELLSQAVMVVESCRPTLTINLAGARQHWLEGMLRHEIVCTPLQELSNDQPPRSLP
ncbi:microtubule-associated tyrosine carboxypeptidase 1-like [Scomber japonicus]|uniref:microtubule-associated tyrosine carboxypeptidase 1-like n=1 Tax=Scomber japonicus TaxID=13676 RepID=UPI00230624F3|nr:microtubule-associated tyrosine carboxypeptidase 1-like [Scomber japonicus]